jgi:GNAT superfamily N-acetyltransferase
MDGIAISDFTPGDDAAVHAFLKSVFDELGYDFDLTAKDCDLTDIPRSYQSKGCFLLARLDNRLVGTAAIRSLSDEVCELKRFYVGSPSRGRGIGGALLREAIAYARRGAWSKLVLDTTPRSTVAIALFTKNGFKEIDRYNENSRAERFFELPLIPNAV